MSVFKKTSTKMFVKSFSELTSDNSYWKNYNTSVLVKEFGPIDYVDFSPTEPCQFAITCSCRVQIYNSITKLVTKNLNKFKQIAYGGTYRNDGRLLCAGGDDANIKLFDINTKSTLRIFMDHIAPVHRTFFSLDGMQIISFSDDKTTAIWDIASEKRLISFQEHTDYVRAGGVSPISSDIYISGGYDKIVNMYDTRTNKKVFSVNHDAPVESVLFLPSGGIFLSAGGTEVRIWDCLTNGKLLAKISQHHKTVTCLRIAYNGQKILSGSLDRHVKIYDSGTYKTVHTLEYPNSVLSIGISGDNDTIVAGMVDGMISIKQKEDIKEKTAVSKRISYRYSGETLHSLHINTYIQEVTKEEMGKHDICLRKFQYSKALDHVMISYIVNKSPHITIAVLQELIRRQGLIQALAGRDGKPLANILRFIIRHIGSIHYGRLLLHTTNVLIDIYGDLLDELNFESQVMFSFLEKKLQEEEDIVLSLIQLQGAFEMILLASETTSYFTTKFSSKLTPSLSAQKDLILCIP